MKKLLLTVLVGLLVLSVSGKPISTSDDSRKRARQDKKDKSKEDVVELETTLITTNVAVRDHQSRFVSDLKPKDFHIFDNGIEQKISFFGLSEEPFSVILVLDNSGSAKEYLRDEQDLAVDFVNELHPADRVAVISFSTTAKSLLPDWTNNKEALTTAIRETVAAGSTSLLRTLTGVAHLLKQIKGRKAVILLTDGIDNQAGASLDSILKEFQAIDALAYVVRYSAAKWLDFPKNLDDLQILADSSSLLSRFTAATGGVMIDRKPDHPQQLAHSIAEELRHQYILGYYPDAALKPGKKNTIKIKVDRPNVNVSARRSYGRK
jgi:Ca-activated chloride channel family protein